MRLAVISDIHGNGRALDAAIAAARAVGPDRIVLLGDLLTYGVDVGRVRDRVASLVERDGALLLRGNHDRLYTDLAAGDTRYFDRLPAWIRESVEDTMRREGGTAWLAALPWRDEWVADSVLFAHANPFGPGDWTYLNDGEALARAAGVLRDRALSVGVFGHTHRAVLLDVTEPDQPAALAGPAATGGPNRRLLVNAGSVGQPRGSQFGSTIAIVDAGPSPAVRLVPLDYDVAAHLEGLAAAGMSAETTAKLRSFFVAPAG